MRILDRYISRQFLGTLIFALIAFCLIFIIVDLVGYLDKFIDREVPRIMIIKYYLYYLPYIVVLSFPVAMLLASLFSVGQLARYNEVIAMTSAGISLYRILFPLFVLGLIISGIILYSGEKIVPFTNQKKIDLYKLYVDKYQSNSPKRENDIYAQISKNEWLSIGYYDTKINTGYKVSIQKLDKQFKSIIERTDAAKIVWENDQWVLLTGMIRKFSADNEKIEKIFERLEYTDLDLIPEEFSKKQKKTEEMSYWELKQFITNIKRNGGDPSRWLVDLYLKISFPFANFIIVLFGAPLASRKTRSGPAISFGISLFICFLYFGIIKTGQAFGHTGTLPPFLAAWLGNIIFGIAAIMILFRVRK